MEYPNNVGIKAMEIYVPGQALDQSLFEQHQGVSAGKYTIGLGLKYMNFCDDREVSSLLKKYSIDPKSIGRLEVGTESLIDKAKSIKTVLTQLFEPAGNTSLEGIDTINACYGGTSALFNAVNWVESRSWDGRDAIVVASDIALYKEASSRPTGGAGCVAMLVGPDAVLSLDPALKGTFMTHAYDFYKPDLKAEFPVVNGHESLRCYTSALDGCYNRLRERVEEANVKANGHGPKTDTRSLLDIFDYMAFHTPNCKLVSKSYGRLLYNDYKQDGDEDTWGKVPAELRELSYEDSLKSKELEKLFVTLSKDRFKSRVEPCIAAPTQCGNMYTGSLYCSLISLISNIDLKDSVGKTIGMFSYGSGIASTLFALKVTGDLTELVQKIDIMDRLSQRKISTPEEYEEACALRLKAYGAKSFEPSGSIENMARGTYYLKEIDESYRRTYVVKE
ncbi:Hydroxymethylglutaryl-CoA synthase [Colletotrichum sp. SAR 10_70]|nr:Hydroxymethylglutaryl-CoA synthase [Colletotrichum sp. SAR 10_71]KAI8168587.1 Hydroxymethylglutaryl-CoA synthase [Colletotrichum sp. SAR 10_65]KAI8174466.1 Hydroxymethylglutaryl-CoA synthase [Colletotrichum sp. SAR 10_70]KAI8179603.1 Hydroxymethylglutaryl-CoA synthase [Colletotrichum sp. SAR 10_75]KAI8201836.1 Hydroxymethylglutaryl-CoA synthase [Colletotrichum sp. SAR 10_76]KAI8220870.1 Hydroxymethylglutaryl-CoA synthase [Colletotrichum sp. SAR 10_86]KAJ4996739.1 Hydroxymethylglutaryl-CoA 